MHLLSQPQIYKAELQGVIFKFPIVEDELWHFSGIDWKVG